MREKIQRVGALSVFLLWAGSVSVATAASHLFLPGREETCLWVGGVSRPFFDSGLNNTAAGFCETRILHTGETNKWRPPQEL